MNASRVASNDRKIAQRDTSFDNPPPGTIGTLCKGEFFTSAITDRTPQCRKQWLDGLPYYWYRALPLPRIIDRSIDRSAFTDTWIPLHFIRHIITGAPSFSRLRAAACLARLSYHLITISLLSRNSPRSFLYYYGLVQRCFLAASLPAY